MILHRRTLGLAAPLIALLCALVPVHAAAPAAGATEMGPRLRAVAPAEPLQARVIVKYRSSAALVRAAGAGRAAPLPRHAAALGARLGLALRDGRALGPRTQAVHAAGIGSEALARQLAAQPDVEWAVVSRRRTVAAVVPDDPLFRAGQGGSMPAVGQWTLRAPDNTAVSAINALGAWAFGTGAPSVTVAVLDTGVRFDHPDLAGKLHPGRDFVSSTDDTPGDSDADATDPGDWTDAGSPCGAGDSSWHGTQVAGLIAAASDNAIGMAGAGRDVMVLPVRVLGQCGGFDDDIVAGMRWAGGLTDASAPNPHPAQVINMSLGAPGACEAVYADTIAELTAAGVAVVVAAGNDVGTAVASPANCPGAIAVGGVRHVGSKVGYSNIGPQVAIAAPAGNCVNTSGACLYPLVTTTNLGATTASTNGYSDSLNYSVGTSFSAPLVAGTAALMLSQDPTLTPAALRALLQSTARPFPSLGAAAGVAACQAPGSTEQIECYCTTSTCGAGLLDAAAAVAAAAGATAPPVAIITASADTVAAGTAIQLGAGSSSRSVVAQSWEIVDGAERARLRNAPDAASTVLDTSEGGTVTVRLTVTDAQGAQASSTRSITVTAAPVVPAPAPSGGGGGASSALWLALLALASVSLRRADSARSRR